MLVCGSVPPDVAEFLEKQAFEDFGMMKKGVIGMELTKLLRIAKENIEKVLKGSGSCRRNFFMKSVNQFFI
jgi:hypothetical protein